MNAPVRRGRRGEHGELERVVRRAQIPRRRARNVREGVRVHFYVVSAQSLARSERRLQRAADLLLGQPLELKHAAAGDDRGRHGRVRVFRRRADKDDRALLDERQQRIELRLVETVALVEQKIGALVVELERRARVLRSFLHIGDAALHCVQLDEIAVCRARDNVRERRLAAAGRSPKDAAPQPVQPDGAAQKAPLRNDMALPDELIEVGRAHLLRKRLCRVFIVVQIKEVHTVKIPLFYRIMRDIVLDFRAKTAYSAMRVRIFSEFSFPMRYPASYASS